MKGFRVLGDPLFSRGLTSRLRIGARSVAGGAPDTTPPTVIITCAQSSPSAATTLNFTITFKNGVGGENEEVTGFNISKFAITNGTKSNFAGSGAVYTCDVTPTGMSVVTANVAADVAQDAAGNNNTAATQVSITSTAPFSDAFTRGDGAIGSIWTGSTWTIATNAALNTPTLGNELVVNPGFEGTYTGGGTISVAPNWVNNNADTGVDTLIESATAHGGSKSQSINVDAQGEGVGTATNILTTATFYQLSAWLNITSGAARIIDGTLTFLRALGPTGGSWVQLITTNRPSTANNAMYVQSSAGAANFLVDDASAKALVMSTAFATLPNVSVSDVTAQALVTVDPVGFQAGLVINLDSTSNPQNFIIAYLDGRGNVKLDKCVSGTVSAVITGAGAFGATKNLKVVKSGNNYSLYYGTLGSETQIGATTEVTGMTGTIHGLFSTYPQPKFDNFQISATP